LGGNLWCPEVIERKMPLFKKPKSEPRTAWVPTIDLAVARPAVFALANAPASGDVQVRAAVAEFVRLSERPSLEKALDLIRSDPDVLNRPWMWLTSVMNEADASGDHHLAAAGLFWACYWTSQLLPRMNLGSMIDIELDPIPESLRIGIASVGTSAARQLPPEFVVVGDESGNITAGPLAHSAAAMLGI
jgi:hypothetical protein